MQERQQTALELMEYGPLVSTVTMHMPWRGTMCPDNFLLLRLQSSCQPLIYELYENSKGVSRPSVGSVIGIHNNCS